MYLLDSDTCIRFIRKDKSVTDKVLRRDLGEIRTSIVTYYELQVGLEKSTGNIASKRSSIEKMFEVFPIAPFGTVEARETAKIRAWLEKRGTPIGTLDNLIAGTARSKGWILVTGNVREFSRIPDLKIETW